MSRIRGALIGCGFFARNQLHAWQGIEGVEMTDKAVDRNGVACYGAIGVGGTKMKIHTAALKRLFDGSEGVLDNEAIYRIGESLES